MVLDERGGALGLRWGWVRGERAAHHADAMCHECCRCIPAINMHGGSKGGREGCVGGVV